MQRARGQPAADDRALVLAEQPLDALQRDRIDVPGVARDVVDLLHAAVVGRMEAVVHARGQAQRHVLAAAVVAHQLGVAAADPPAGTESPSPAAPIRPATCPQAPTIASQGLTSTAGIGVDRPRAVLELAREAVVQALERVVLRFAQIQIGEQPPQARCRRAHTQGCSIRLSQPMKLREPAARNAVGQQEIDVFLLHDPLDQGARSHLNVIRLQYSARRGIP